MNVGFSTLSLFMKPLDEMLEIAARDNFDSIELLSEAVYGPEHLLENKHLLEPFFSYDLDYYIHAPNIDINIASLNKGIRLESIRQIKSCLDLAEVIDAKLNSDNTTTFETDRFSTYTVTYSDVLLPASPNTGDSVMMYVMLGIVSILSLITLRLVSVKKNW